MSETKGAGTESNWAFGRGVDTSRRRATSALADASVPSALYATAEHRAGVPLHRLGQRLPRGQVPDRHRSVLVSDRERRAVRAEGERADGVAGTIGSPVGDRAHHVPERDERRSVRRERRQRKRRSVGTQRHARQHVAGRGVHPERLTDFSPARDVPQRDSLEGASDRERAAVGRERHVHHDRRRGERSRRQVAGRSRPGTLSVPARPSSASVPAMATVSPVGLDVDAPDRTDAGVHRSRRRGSRLRRPGT